MLRFKKSKGKGGEGKLVDADGKAVFEFNKVSRRLGLGVELGITQNELQIEQHVLPDLNFYRFLRRLSNMASQTNQVLSLTIQNWSCSPLELTLAI